MIWYRRLTLYAVMICCAATAAQCAPDARLRNSFHNPTQDGWIFVHLEGTPAEIGFQHGYWLTAEIEDSKRAIELSVTHQVKHS